MLTGNKEEFQIKRDGRFVTKALTNCNLFYFSFVNDELMHSLPL